MQIKRDDRIIALAYHIQGSMRPTTANRKKDKGEERKEERRKKGGGGERGGGTRGGGEKTKSGFNYIVMRSRPPRVHETVSRNGKNHIHGGIACRF